MSSYVYPNIKPFSAEHWPEIRKIYQSGIATELATFETEVPDWNSWDEKHIPDCRLAVFDDQDQILAWAALSPISSRHVYRGVMEVSIYVDVFHRAKGIGGKLMDSLVRSSETHGIWTLQAHIFEENSISIHLHKQFGFRVVGLREKYGQLRTEWKNVVLMERRSQII